MGGVQITPVRIGGGRRGGRGGPPGDRYQPVVELVNRADDNNNHRDAAAAAPLLHPAPAAALQQDAPPVEEERVEAQAGEDLPVEAHEELLLAPFLNPVMPDALPHNPAQDTGEGWGAIDRLHPWQCFLSTYSLMEEVPRQNRHMWAWAWGTVLERILITTTEQERERGP